MSDLLWIVLVLLGIAAGSEVLVRLNRRWLRGVHQNASQLIATQLERESRQAAGKAPSLSGPAAKGIQGTRRHTILDMAERRKHQAQRSQS